MPMYMTTYYLMIILNTVIQACDFIRVRYVNGKFSLVNRRQRIEITPFPEILILIQLQENNRVHY